MGLGLVRGWLGTVEYLRLLVPKTILFTAFGLSSHISHPWGPFGLVSCSNLMSSAVVPTAHSHHGLSLRGSSGSTGGRA